MRRRDFLKSAWCPMETRPPATGMIRRRNFTLRLGLVCAVLAVGCGARATAAGAGPGRCISLSGSDWHLHDDPDGQGASRGLDVADPSAPGWIPASVPGNVQADLETAHQFKPLWYGAGEVDHRLLCGACSVVLAVVEDGRRQRLTTE